MRALGFPHDASETMTRRLREVTAEQVVDVARKYLVDDKLTVAVLEPRMPGQQASAAGVREAAAK